VAASYAWWIHRQLAPIPAAPDPPPWWRTLLLAVLTAGIVLLGVNAARKLTLCRRLKIDPLTA